MSRLMYLLVFFVLILSLALIKQPVPGDDKSEKLWRGLLQFADAAEIQMANKPDVRLWKLQRIETIRKLNELRKKLDNVCFYINCSKAAGSGMGIVCILTSLFTFLVSSLGITFPLPVIAGVTCPTAYFTTSVSSMLEAILSRKYQNDLQTVLMKDKELSRSLNEWLGFSRNLEAEFKNIFGFDFKSKKSITFVILQEFNRLLPRAKNFKSSLDQIKNGRYSSFIGKDIGIDVLEAFYKRNRDHPEFSYKIRKTLSFLNDLFKIQSGFEGNQKIKFKKMLSLVLIALDSLDINIPPMIKVSALFSLKVLELANHVTSLIDEAKIIIDGKCAYSDSLKHITDMLSKELDIIMSVFPSNIN